MKFIAYPKNKSKYLRLLKFGNQINKICTAQGVYPKVHGSMAYFIYTSDKSIVINDIDYLVPFKSIKKLIKVFKIQKFKLEYIPKWKVLIVHNKDLKIDFDGYDRKNLSIKKITVLGNVMSVLNKKDLIKIYKHASENSKDKPTEMRKKYLKLKGLK